MDCLRRLRLLFEEFPSKYNVVLFSQAEMLRTLRLTMNQDLHSRLTYSATARKLAPDAMEQFVLSQFDRCGLPHNTLTPEALALIARSSDGVLRAARNLTLLSCAQGIDALIRVSPLPPARGPGTRVSLTATSVPARRRAASAFERSESQRPRGVATHL